MNRGRRAGLILAAVGAVTATVVVVAPTAQAGAALTIVGAGGRCVDVAWAQTANGTTVQIADCSDNVAQDWFHDGGEGPLRALGKCLDVANGDWSDGNRIQLYDCNGTAAQQWRFAGGRWVNGGSGKCLDAYGGGNDGTPLQLRSCIDSPTQQWSGPGKEKPAVVNRQNAPTAIAGKKGVSTWAFPGAGKGIREVGASWYWDWSPDAADLPAQAEFVPMIWGHLDPETGAIDNTELDLARRWGDTLLGFNEPDRGDQSNLTVEKALDLWPQLERTGKRLGSPAVARFADRPGSWLDQFMAGARQRGMRVDFIALHWYGTYFGPEAADHLMTYVSDVHRRYGLPVWVTEFGLIRPIKGGNVYPEEAELTRFITDATARLNEADYVERYAWFAPPTTGEHAKHSLYNPDGSRTAAGEAYRRS